MKTAMKTMMLAAVAALVLAACQGTKPEQILVQTPAPSAPRFDKDIAAFEAADKEAMPPKCATLFVGSSTIKRWTTLKEDFPGRTVINRGFGGSTAWEVDAYFSRIVTPYHPKEIVYYAGDNDLAADRTPDDVFADFAAFMRMKDQQLGKTPVYFISVKPSVLRWSMQLQMTEVNARVRQMAEKRDDLMLINVVQAMMNPDGSLKDIFVEDNLHMKPEGYAIWTPIVKAALDRGQEDKAPGC
jgi:lysophospholipase L1-like esterase